MVTRNVITMINPTLTKLLCSYIVRKLLVKISHTEFQEKLFNSVCHYIRSQTNMTTTKQFFFFLLYKELVANGSALVNYTYMCEQALVC
jgi:hypothetical protein